jgi:hypothetical protein
LLQLGQGVAVRPELTALGARPADRVKASMVSGLPEGEVEASELTVAPRLSRQVPIRRLGIVEWISHDEHTLPT